MSTASHSAGKYFSTDDVGPVLLAPDEAPALIVERAESDSPFVLVCEHAGRELPQKLDTLGLSITQLCSHIAWDIGAAGLARQLAQRLDATLVLQRYSRLVIDCNRPLDAEDSIVTHGEYQEIAGNTQLKVADIEARQREIFTPFHEGLRALLDARQRAHKPTILIAIHSFTPIYRGESRPWHIGVMYHHDPRLAHALLGLLGRDERLVVGDNLPYAVTELTDYTLPVHAEARQLLHLGLELRQDLLADESAQAGWAGRLAKLLRQAAGMVPVH